MCFLNADQYSFPSNFASLGLRIISLVTFKLMVDVLLISITINWKLLGLAFIECILNQCNIFLRSYLRFEIT